MYYSNNTLSELFSKCKRNVMKKITKLGFFTKICADFNANFAVFDSMFLIHNLLMIK